MLYVSLLCTLEHPFKSRLAYKVKEYKAGKQLTHLLVCTQTRLLKELQASKNNHILLGEP